VAGVLAAGTARGSRARRHGPRSADGLPEYRNGGLFLDTGVIAPLDAEFLRRSHAVDDEAIVEWRALTVIGLDRIAVAVREILGVTAEAFPLARVLEGGTWAAGRRIAAERREGARLR
jgi:hypothetical protein